MRNLTVTVYSAPWCPPCRAHHKTIKRWSAARAGGVHNAPKVEEIDIDTPAGELDADARSVQAVPTTIVLHNGVELARATGALDDKALNRLIQKAERKMQTNEENERKNHGKEK